MEHGRYYSVVLPRLNSIIRVSKLRKAGIEDVAQENPDRFPRAATLFKVIKSRLPARNFGNTTSSPVAGTPAGNASR